MSDATENSSPPIERNPSAYVPVPEGGESGDAGYIQDGAPVACSGFAPAAIARTCSGVTGTAAIARETPSASSTAAAIAAPAPSTPPSPAPLTPSGLPGDGASSRISVPTAGISAADGSR